MSIVVNVGKYGWSLCLGMREQIAVDAAGTMVHVHQALTWLLLPLLPLLVGMVSSVAYTGLVGVGIRVSSSSPESMFNSP